MQQSVAHCERSIALASSPPAPPGVAATIPARRRRTSSHTLMGVVQPSRRATRPRPTPSSSAPLRRVDRVGQDDADRDRRVPRQPRRDATLAAAKQAWLTARDDYLPTEAFRFYDGPIDNPEDGPEGQINAWPMDEAYVDYVADDAERPASSTTRPSTPRSPPTCSSRPNEKGGETNISTGWHAIEFLLWGQDPTTGQPGNASGHRLHDRAERRPPGRVPRPRRPTCSSPTSRRCATSGIPTRPYPHDVRQEPVRRRSPTSCAASAR